MKNRYMNSFDVCTDVQDFTESYRILEGLTHTGKYTESHNFFYPFVKQIEKNMEVYFASTFYGSYKIKFVF